MSMLRVTSDQLISLAASLNNGNDQVQQQLTGLHNLVAPVEAEWQGSGATSFQQLWAQWAQSASQLSEALTGISTLLQQAGTTYAGADAAVQSSMQQ